MCNSFVNDLNIKQLTIKRIGKDTAVLSFSKKNPIDWAMKAFNQEINIFFSMKDLMIDIKLSKQSFSNDRLSSPRVGGGCGLLRPDPWEQCWAGRLAVVKSPCWPRSRAGVPASPSFEFQPIMPVHGGAGLRSEPEWSRLHYSTSSGFKRLAALTLGLRSPEEHISPSLPPFHALGLVVY